MTTRDDEKIVGVEPEAQVDEKLPRALAQLQAVAFARQIQPIRQWLKQQVINKIEIN